MAHTAHLHEDRSHSAAAPYRLSIEFDPSAPRAGELAQLTCVLANEATGAMPRLAPAHEKLLHLIVVRRDLASFQHLHPEVLADGNLRTEIRFPTPGEYMFFADFTPKGEEGQVARASVTIAGPSSDPLNPDADQPKVDGNVQATLVTEPAALVTGAGTLLTFQLTDRQSGKPIPDLRPYLGARGHAVILSADGQEYLHTHPLEAGEGAGIGVMSGWQHFSHSAAHGMLSHGAGAHDSGVGAERAMVAFHTRFPRPGLYKV